MIESVCVYCASSNRSAAIYLDAAARLGRILAENGITIVCAIALPGGCGTLEELFEAITWKTSASAKYGSSTDTSPSGRASTTTTPGWWPLSATTWTRAIPGRDRQSVGDG